MRAEAGGKGRPQGAPAQPEQGAAQPLPARPWAGRPAGVFCGLQQPAKAGIVIFIARKSRAETKNPYKVRVVRKSRTLRNRRLTDLMVGLVARNRAEW